MSANTSTALADAGTGIYGDELGFLPVQLGPVLNKS
jgi:hypothetical protein